MDATEDVGTPDQAEIPNENNPQPSNDQGQPEATDGWAMTLPPAANAAMDQLFEDHRDLQDQVPWEQGEIQLSAEGLAAAGAEAIVDEAEAAAAREVARAQEITDRAAAAEAQAAADLADIQGRKEECAVCYEDKPLSEVLHMACQEHWLCREHIQDCFQRAVDSQANYPPQCCQAVGRIELDDVDHWLPAELIATYKFKESEYHTDVRLRCYCGDDSCHKFLQPSRYEEAGDHTVADCPDCKKSTCVVCKQVVSKEANHDCKKVILNETNTAYSAEMRFKACPFCGRFGQLENACNHVTCLSPSCYGEWCFICVEAWNGGEGHNECQQYNDPVYDNEGYDQRGFHRDTGFDREGYTKGGYNIRGLNRNGERMVGFADRTTPRRNRVSNAPAGFGDLDDVELEEAILAGVLEEQARGLLADDVILDELIQERFEQMGGQPRGGFHGGVGRVGRLLADADNDEPNDNGEREEELREEIGDLGAEIAAVNARMDQHRAMQGLDGAAYQVPEGQDVAGNDEGDDIIAQLAQDDALLHDLAEQLADLNNRLQQLQQDLNNENQNADDGVDNEPRNQSEDGNDDNEPQDAAPADNAVAGTNSPPFQQRQCQHNFEERLGMVICSVCTLPTNVDDSNFHLLCPDCQAITCTTCAFDYAAMVQVNWPGLDDGHAQGENNAGDDGEGNAAAGAEFDIIPAVQVPAAAGDEQDRDGDVVMSDLDA